MAYAEFGIDSDVYVYDGGDDGLRPLVCASCKLSEARAIIELSYVEMLEHLIEHLEAGHKVPMHCTDRLSMEFESKQTLFGHPIPDVSLVPPERN